MHRSAHNPAGAPRRGVVLIITMLALVLLLSLVLFVLNTGDQVNRRQQMQDTADATAIGGATWLARCLNLIAENNVAMSMNLGLINTLDAMPQATDFVYREQLAFVEALQAQMARGLTNRGGAEAELLTELMGDYLDELEAELDQIEPVYEYYQRINVPNMTYYNAPSGGHGAIWQAMFAMDELNQATIESIGSTTQTMAIDAGETTLRQHRGITDMLVLPVRAELPYERGEFNDFEHPVKYGVLPEGIDDVEQRRGPYDTVFGWHGLNRECLSGYFTGGNRQIADGGRGSIPVGRGSGGANSGQVWNCTDWQVNGYYTWGTHRHMFDRVNSFTDTRLRNTRLEWWTRRLSNAKLQYLWPDPAPDNPEEDPPDDSYPELEEIIDPEWVMDYDEARAFARTNRRRVRETGYIVVEIKSSVAPGGAGYLSEGTWALVDENGEDQPRLVRRRGWVDPSRWDRSASVDKVAEHVWRETWSYSVLFDNALGIEPALDSAGNATPVPVYRVDHYIFAGINIGDPVEIPNCYEGFEKGSSSAPAPMNVRLEDTEEDRFEYLTVLAVTRQRDRAFSWPSGFRGRKPDPYMVAAAQAKVFNSHSWDSWTPMWHASLAPVDRWDEWRARVTRSGDHRAVRDDTLEFFAEYFERTTDLAEVMLRH